MRGFPSVGDGFYDICCFRMKTMSRAFGQKKKWVLFVGFLGVLVAVAVAWQVAFAEIGNIEFRDDLRDIASQNGVNIGLNPPKTDDQIRQDVVAAAADCGFHLQADEVRLERIADPFHLHYNLDVSYARRMNLLVYSFDLHFKQAVASK